MTWSYFCVKFDTWFIEPLISPKHGGDHQTFPLEDFRNVVNHFAPKSIHCFYPADEQDDNSTKGKAVVKFWSLLMV